MGACDFFLCFIYLYNQLSDERQTNDQPAESVLWVLQVISAGGGESIVVIMLVTPVEVFPNIYTHRIHVWNIYQHLPHK